MRSLVNWELGGLPVCMCVCVCVFVVVLLLVFFFFFFFFWGGGGGAGDNVWSILIGTALFISKIFVEMCEKREKTNQSDVAI